MKNLVVIVLLLLMICQSCYEDYKKDFEYTATYFALQKPHRVLVAEEGNELTFDVGVVLGGKYVNEEEEIVYFEVDPALLPDTLGMEVLPTNYYTFSDADNFVIPEGRFLGTVTVSLNESFINDPKSSTLHYVLPLKIVESTTDSILNNKSTTLVAVQYHNQYYGAYWIKGEDSWLNAFGNPFKSTVYSNPDITRNTYRYFSTITKDTSTIPYVGVDISGINALKLAIKEDGTLSIHDGFSMADSLRTISEISGTGTYNKEEQTFYLDYTYTEAGTKHLVIDTLVYFATPLNVSEW